MSSTRKVLETNSRFSKWRQTGGNGMRAFDEKQKESREGKKAESREEGCHVWAVSAGIRNSELGSCLGRCRESCPPPQGCKGQKNRNDGRSDEGCHLLSVCHESGSVLSILCALFHLILPTTL